MKVFRSKTGRFNERPHFSDGEIDRMCVAELRKVSLYPTAPGEIRIERFLEKRFGISPTYDDLPVGLLGYTKFGAKGVEEIVIARSLGEEESTVAERRIRSTMAHEAGHGLLHTSFIALSGSTCPLFTEEGRRSHVLCRGGNEPGAPARGYDGQWWEFQANQAIGGLLLPKPLVVKAMQPYLIDVGGAIPRPMPDPARMDDAIAALADIFNVNPAVARIRVENMYPQDAGGQLSL